MSDELQRIRVACAEALGWTYQHGSEPTYGGTYIKTGWHDSERNFHACPFSDIISGLPAWESDPAAALTLVERLKSEGWRMNMDNWGNEGTEHAWTCMFTKDGEEDTMQSYGVAFAEAIARAYLKCKGVTI